MSVPGPVALIQSKFSVSPGLKILLVEGPDDLAVYDKWLARLAAPMSYKATINLQQARGREGGKTPVLQCLRWFADHGGEPRVFGLVDRDEWDDATCAARRTELAQLRVNERRHAVESYFCDPDDIAPALGLLYHGLDIQPLRDALDAARERYVCHWALLTTTDRLKVRMTEINYPGQFSTSIPVPSDSDIQARFQLWSQTLDPAQAFASFDQLRQESLNAPTAAQYCRCVWAKRFYDDVIHPALNALPGVPARSGRDWLTDLAELVPVIPPDAEAILRPLI